MSKSGRKWSAYYVNRAGGKLSADQRAKLDQVKSLLGQSLGR